MFISALIGCKLLYENLSIGFFGSSDFVLHFDLSVEDLVPELATDTETNCSKLVMMLHVV